MEQTGIVMWNCGYMAAPGIDWRWIRRDEMERREAELRKELITKQKTIAELIIQGVCLFHGISIDKLKIATRKREITKPRMQAMSLIDKYTRLSLSEIGNLFDGKDHATVLHAKKTVSNDCQTDSQYCDQMNDLEKEVRRLLVSEKLETYTKIKIS